MASPKQAAAVEAAVKYPNLEKLNGKLWDKFEELNRSGPDSRMVVRGARNMISNFLTDELFWETVRDVVKRHSKFTNNKKKGDVKVRVCNMAKTAIMTPGASDGLKKLAVDAYGAATAAKTDDAVRALQSLVEIVESGRVNTFLETANGLMENVVLNPKTVKELFFELRKLMDSGSKMKLNETSANRLISLSNKIQGNFGANPSPNRVR